MTGRAVEPLHVEPVGEWKVCGNCQGPLTLLGKLGNLTHYRCRNCGMDTSIEEKKS